MDYTASILARLPGASSRRNSGLKRLIETLESYMTPEQIEPVARAYEFGALAHEGQKRMSGEPYISHPVAVAQSLADMHMDSQSITAAILHDVIDSHEKVLPDPAPVIKVHELADSSVNFVVRPWARTADYWDVYWDVTRKVKERFDAEGVSIPFPQRDVHMYQESGA